MTVARGSVRWIGFGESTPVPEEMVDNESVLAALRERGVDTKGKTGADTEKLVGIRTRWWSKLSSTEHALAATRAAVADAERRTGGAFSLDQVRLIHSGGSSPDNLYPACACELQGRLGLPGNTVEARDVSLACASWLDAMVLAASRMRDRGYRYGLVAVGETVGTRANAPTSLSHLLWGDGGGAVVVEYDPEGDPDYGLLADAALSDGQYAGWTRSIGIGTLPDHRSFEFLDSSMLDHGRDIHRYGIREVSAVIRALLERAGLTAEGAWLVPHNANLGMVLKIGENVGVPVERVLHRVTERGNTSSASLPITLAMHAERGTFRRGDLLILASFGGGMATDLMLYRWP